LGAYVASDFTRRPRWELSLSSRRARRGGLPAVTGRCGKVRARWAAFSRFSGSGKLAWYSRRTAYFEMRGRAERSSDEKGARWLQGLDSRSFLAFCLASLLLLCCRSRLQRVLSCLTRRNGSAFRQGRAGSRSSRWRALLRSSPGALNQRWLIILLHMALSRNEPVPTADTLLLSPPPLSHSHQPQLPSLRS